MNLVYNPETGKYDLSQPNWVDALVIKDAFGYLLRNNRANYFISPDGVKWPVEELEANSLPGELTVVVDADGQVEAQQDITNAQDDEQKEELTHPSWTDALIIKRRDDYLVNNRDDTWSILDGGTAWIRTKYLKAEDVIVIVDENGRNTQQDVTDEALTHLDAAQKEIEDLRNHVEWLESELRRVGEERDGDSEQTLQDDLKWVRSELARADEDHQNIIKDQQQIIENLEARVKVVETREYQAMVSSERHATAERKASAKNKELENQIEWLRSEVRKQETVIDDLYAQLDGED